MALYRNIRPQTFEEVVGQSHVTEILTKALDNQKNLACLLVCGPQGLWQNVLCTDFCQGIELRNGYNIQAL